MAEGVDYSSARPGGAALAAAGKSFAVRYLYPGAGKGLTRAEVADLQAHGISIPVVYESSAQRALAGAGAGAADATVAVAQLAACGLGDLPVYFATDWNATASQMQAIDEYLQGASSVLGRMRVGVYGGLAVIQHVQSSGSAVWLWQTYAWSGTPTRWLPDVHLQQYRNGQTINGGSVDLCRSMFAEYGQNPLVVAPPKMKESSMKLFIVSQENLYTAVTDSGWKDIPLTPTLQATLLQVVGGTDQVQLWTAAARAEFKAVWPELGQTLPANVTVDNTSVLTAVTAAQKSIIEALPKTVTSTLS